MSVPDTNTFNLQNVVDEVNPTTDDLVDCFAAAIDGKFDPAYGGSGYVGTGTGTDRQSNFRNYGVLPLLDKDGNEYTIIIINNQRWIVENYRTTTYADDTSIPNITGQTLWEADTSGAYCYYNNNISFNTVYGCLYNAYTIDNASGFVYLERNSVEESGWRVPTLTDMNNLSTFLSTNPGGKLKETGTTNWTSPNTGAVDEYGFKHVPGGHRIEQPFSFELINNVGDLWTSTESSPTNNNNIQMSYNGGNMVITSFYGYKYIGKSIRLVKDI